MSSTVEVVGQAEGEAVAQVALGGQVRLLRIGVNEVLALRIAEWLEAEWQEGPLGEVEVVLVEEDRIGSIQGLKLLLVWLVEKIRIRLRKGRGRALGLIHESLKDRDGVQVGRVTGTSAGASPGERQLPAA